MIELLHAIWQADSGFPSGSFAFSGGLEAFYALTGSDQTALPDLLHDMLALRWASSDRVALSHAHRASDGLDTKSASSALDAKPASGALDISFLDAIATADAALEAAILVQPLREGSRRNGMALLATHERLGTAGAGPLRAACRDGPCLGHLAVMQGALFRAIGVDLPAAIAASGYGAAASLVTAAVRLGRVGAIEGQRALSGVLPLLAHLAAHSPPSDAVPEAFLPLLDIAAARHARAGMRLFAT
jgi:urease accessory protein